MKHLYFFISTFLFLGCQTGPYQMSKKVKSQVVSNVDIPKFMGDWYVIACIPTPFEGGVHNALENYVWNSEENRVDVTFTFRKDAFDGDRKVMTQKGWIQDPVGKAHWKVSPLWPFKFDYLVIDLASDYSWTTVGVPSKSYVWIMSRRPKMDPKEYQKAKSRIEALGYDMSKLIEVPQNGNKP